MTSYTHFEELKVWKAARELNRRVYATTRHGAFARDFGLRDQIRRASVSIMANIAEGFERSGNAEFIQFLTIAKGSAGELRALLFAALDCSYLDDESFSSMKQDALEISRMLNGFIEYLQKSELKGAKFRHRDSIRDGDDGDLWWVE